MIFNPAPPPKPPIVVKDDSRRPSLFDALAQDKQKLRQIRQKYGEEKKIYRGSTQWVGDNET